MERDTAWARIQHALDERRDPLDDERLQEWFADHPDELARFARLESVIADLPARAERSQVDPRRRVAQLIATCAACLVAILFARAPREEPPVPARAVAQGDARVVDYKLSVTRENDSRRFRATRAMHEPLSITNTILRTQPSAPAGLRRLQHTLETETNR